MFRQSRPTFLFAGLQNYDPLERFKSTVLSHLETGYLFVIIISHRGYWIKTQEKNSQEAFSRSFSLGFGTETDFRDCNQKLVIAHDPPSGDEMTAEDFFRLLCDHGGSHLPLALNIKADSLQPYFVELLRKFEIKNYFFFDMSVPDALSYLRAELPVFTRQSEVEVVPVFYRQAQGVWLDAFDSTWWTPDTIQEHLDHGKTVCIVSPELHKRDPLSTWEMLRAHCKNLDDRVILCTDFPEKAKEFLHA